MDSVNFYRSYHTHPINKLMHLVCIPMIVLTSINFASKISMKIPKQPRPFYLASGKILTEAPTHNAINIIPILYVSYFFIFWNLKIGLIMLSYIAFLSNIGYYWRENDKKWLTNSFILFGFAWIIQFLGHAIECNRPALLTSLSQAVFQAPLFTLEYIYPSLLK